MATSTKTKIANCLFDFALDYLKTIPEYSRLELLYELAAYPVDYEVIVDYSGNAFSAYVTATLANRIAYGILAYQYPYLDIARIMITELYPDYADHPDIIDIAIQDAYGLDRFDIPIYGIVSICYIRKLNIMKYVGLDIKDTNHKVIQDHFNIDIKDLTQKYSSIITKEIEQQPGIAKKYRQAFCKLAGCGTPSYMKTNRVFRTAVNSTAWQRYLVLSRYSYTVVHDREPKKLSDYVMYGFPIIINGFESEMCQLIDNTKHRHNSNPVINFLRDAKRESVRVVDHTKEQQYVTQIRELEVKISNLTSINNQLQKRADEANSLKYKCDKLQTQVDNSTNYQSAYTVELEKNQKLEEESKALRLQIAEMQEQLDNMHTDTNYTLYDKEDCCAMFKVLCIGGHTKSQAKLRNRFNLWEFVDVDKYSAIDARIVNEYDAVLIICNYASHALTEHFMPYCTKNNLIKTYRNSYELIVDDVFTHFNK